MKKFFNTLFILGLFLVQFGKIYAQTSNSDDDLLNTTEFTFPPLHVVIDSVLKRSAMVNFRNQHIGVKESTLESERIYWTRNFGIQADTRYGNLSNFATDNDGINSTAALTTARQFNYSVGVYVKFPIFDFLNRKNQLKLARLEVDEAKSMAESQKEEIRQAVIRLYQDLILKQKILQIRSKSLGDARVNMEMVEKEFRNGVVPISEYVRINSMTADMEAEYEKAMSEFITVKKILEDMAGFAFGLKNSN